MIDASWKVHQSDRTAARTVDGRAVVITIDSQRVQTLNPVGSRIWELADGRSLGDIADQLSLDFRVDRDTALDDARGFVEELVGLGLLTLRETRT